MEHEGNGMNSISVRGASKWCRSNMVEPRNVVNLNTCHENNDKVARGLTVKGTEKTSVKVKENPLQIFVELSDLV